MFFLFFQFGIFAIKKHFMSSKISPLNRILVRGAELAPFGGFSCAAYLLNDLRSGLCSTHFFGLTRLWLNSNPKFANLTQLRLNSNPNLLTWLNSDSTHLSQSWVKSDTRLITFYLIWEKLLTGGGGVRSNVAVGWLFLCKVTDNCKILTFSLRKISDLTLTQAVSSWLNSGLKWQSAWFGSDSTHILDFHGWLDSDSTHLSQSRVKFDSRLMSRAQPCLRSPNLVTFRKYYHLTLFPSGRAGGFSCAAHLLIDLRSPNLVTFPNF